MKQTVKMKKINIYILSFAVGLFLIMSMILAETIFTSTTKDMDDRTLTALKNYMVDKGFAIDLKTAIIKPMVSDAECIENNGTTNCKVNVYQEGLINDFVIVSYQTSNPLTPAQIRATADDWVIKRLGEFANSTIDRTKTIISTGGELIINGK